MVSLKDMKMFNKVKQKLREPDAIKQVKFIDSAVKDATEIAYLNGALLSVVRALWKVVEKDNVNQVEVRFDDKLTTVKRKEFFGKEAEKWVKSGYILGKLNE